MKAKFKTLYKKILAYTLALCVVSGTVCVSFYSFANNEELEPYYVTDASPAIPMFQGKYIDISSLSIEIGDEFVSGDDAIWSAEEGASARKIGNYIYAEAAGKTKFLLEHQNNTQEVYVIVNATEGDYDFKLVDYDFSTNEFNADEWIYAVANGAKPSSVTTINAATQHDKYYRNEFPTSFIQTITNGKRLNFYATYTNYLLFYTNPILTHFADYELSTVASSQGDSSAWVNRGFVLRANINTNAQVYDGTNATEAAIFRLPEDTTTATGTGLYFVNYIYGGICLGAYGKGYFDGTTTAASGQNRYGYNSYGFHTLGEDYEQYKIIDGKDSGATFDKNYLFTVKYASRRTIDITVKGNDVKYTIDKNYTVLDTINNENVYQIKNAMTTSVKDGVEQYPTSNAEFDFDTAFDAHGVTEAGNAIGFSITHNGTYIYSFCVKLAGIESEKDMPKTVDVEFYEVADDGTSNSVVPMTAGKKLDIDKLLIRINDNSYSAQDFNWSGGSDTTSQIKDGYLYSYSKGGTVLTGTLKTNSAVVKKLYVVAKNEGDTEYTIYSGDYRSSINATDVSDWRTTVVDAKGGEFTSAYDYTKQAATDTDGVTAVPSGEYRRTSSTKDGVTTYTYYLRGDTNHTVGYSGNYAYIDNSRGFIPYNASQLSGYIRWNDNWTDNVTKPGASPYSVYTTLDNEIISNLSDYKVTATFRLNTNMRGAIGLVGRVTDTENGKFIAGTSKAAGFLSGSGDRHSYSVAFKDSSANVINITSSNANSSANFVKLTDASVTGNTLDLNDYFYTSVTGNDSTGNNRELRTYVIEYSGNQMTLTAPDIEGSATYTVNQAVGTVGFVAVTQSSADTVYYPTPNLLEISVTLTNVNDSAIISEAVDIEDFSVPTNEKETYADNGNYYFKAESGRNWLEYATQAAGTDKGIYVKDLGKPYSEKIVIPSTNVEGCSGTVTDTGHSLFYLKPVQMRKAIGEVVLTDGYKTIGGFTFASLSFLEKASLPETLTTIGEYAFLNSGVTGITLTNVTSIGASAFNGCNSLSKVFLGESVTTIGESAFSGCTVLQEVTLPCDLETLGANAFKGCTMLKRVYIYSTEATIGEGAIPSGVTIYGLEGSTAEEYANTNGCEFVAIEEKYVYNISRNSKSTLPSKIFGLAAKYNIPPNENFVLYDEVSIVAIKEGTYSTSVTLDQNGEERIVALTINVGEYDASADNIANDNFSLTKTDTPDKYILTVNEGFDHSSFKINGMYQKLEEAPVADDIPSGYDYIFDCADLRKTNITGEKAVLSEYRTSIFGLGASVETPLVTDALKLKFVFRTPTILPQDTSEAKGQFATNITIGSQEVTLTDAGAFIIPTALLHDASVVPTLARGFDVNSKQVKISNSYYKAANVKVENISKLTHDYADFNAVLTNIADEMAEVDIMCVPYIVYEQNGTSYVLYGEQLTRNHKKVYSTRHISEVELTASSYRTKTDERIEEIKNNKSTVTATGTKYYISSSTGSDTTSYGGFLTLPNSGKSQSNPIKTIERLNELSLKAGDIVYFKRGDIWRGSITAVEGVTYTAYGDENMLKPEIWGSTKDHADASNWQATAENPNIYKCTDAISVDVGTMIFYDPETDYYAQEALCAIKAVIATKSDGTLYNKTTGKAFSGYTDLDTDLHFYHDRDTGYVYLYSAQGNPGDRFASIEFAEANAIFTVGDRSTGIVYDGSKIDNITMRYSGVYGVGASSCDGLTVQNCEFYWIGGSAPSTTNTTRLGNGVEIWGIARNFTVENCYFYQIYDAAVTFQYTGSNQYISGEADTVKFKNNVMEYCNYAVEYFITNRDAQTDERTTDGHIKDFEIVGNYSWYAGYGLCEQRPDKGEDAHIKTWNHVNPSISNLVIADNVFALARSYLLETYTYDPNSEAITYSGNIYIQYMNNLLGRNGYLSEFVKFDTGVQSEISSNLKDKDAITVWVER